MMARYQSPATGDIAYADNPAYQAGLHRAGTLDQLRAALAAQPPGWRNETPYWTGVRHAIARRQAGIPTVNPLLSFTPNT